MTKTTYTEMVDSGIEWIGKIPKERTMRKNKWFLIRNKNTIWTRNTDEYPLLSLTLKWVIEKDKENNDWKIPESYDTYQIVEKNSLILCLFDIDVTPRIVWITPKKGMITWAYTNFSVNEKIADINFMYYFLLRMNIENIFLHMSKSLRSTITYGQFLVQYSCLPNLVTQQAIASYLDSKTAQIDQAISLKTQQIELLREKRSSLINQVVTKWLDPNVELVDSGIEWIGEIPKGWEVRKLKYWSNLINWYSFDSNTYVDDGFPIIRISDVGQEINFDDVKRIPYDMADSISKFKIINGDILIAMTWATIGKSSLFNYDQDCYLNQRVWIIRANNILDQKYLYYFVWSNIFRENIDLACAGWAQENIGKPELWEIILSLPPLETQQSIASYLDTKTAEIDQTIALVQKSIDLLVEYKQSLISHVVTGKVKVG